MRVFVGVLAALALLAAPVAAQIEIQPDTLVLSAVGDEGAFRAVPAVDPGGLEGWWQRRAIARGTEYRSLDPAIATVTSSGLAIAIAPGVARVVGSYRSLADTAVVVVGPGLPVDTIPPDTTAPPPPGVPVFPSIDVELRGDSVHALWLAKPEHGSYTIAQMDTARRLIPGQIFENAAADSLGVVRHSYALDPQPGFLRYVARDQAGRPIAADRVDLPFAGLQQPPPPPPPPPSGQIDLTFWAIPLTATAAGDSFPTDTITFLSLGDSIGVCIRAASRNGAPMPEADWIDSVFVASSSGPELEVDATLRACPDTLMLRNGTAIPLPR